MTDPPKSVPVFEEMKKYQETLPEPSRTYMQYVNDRAVDKLGPILLPVADALKDHPGHAVAVAGARHAADRRRSSCCTASTTASFRRSKRCCSPNTSRARREVEGLLSGLITHAEVNRTASVHRSLATREVLARR